jgi:hypothetical protein
MAAKKLAIRKEPDEKDGCEKAHNKRRNKRKKT